MSGPSAAASRIVRHSTRNLNAARSFKAVQAALQTQVSRARLQGAAFFYINASSSAPSRFISSTSASRAGLMPDSEDPKPPSEDKLESHRPTQPTELRDDEYHEHADALMDSVHEKAEAIQESREDVEVEYSAGVLSITFPPNGTYIINKQPPNKQIWLSSPISGPKRFDWVLEGESMHQKEGGGQGEWVYLRDGTTLSSLLNKELGILPDHHAPDMNPSTDAVE